MTIDISSECLDRIGAALVGVAGVAGVASTVASGLLPVAVGAGLLASACAGRAALRQRVANRETNAAAEIDDFARALGNNWRDWSGLSASGERVAADLEAASHVFEAHFAEIGPDALPSPRDIVTAGLDAGRLATLMLERAATVAPHDYDPAHRANRDFFERVIGGALVRLVERPGFVASLQPA